VAGSEGAWPAGAGLTALLRANAVLFAGMHVAGAVVLVYLGVTAWRSARREEGEFGEALQLRLPAGRTPRGQGPARRCRDARRPGRSVRGSPCGPNQRCATQNRQLGLGRRHGALSIAPQPSESHWVPG